MGCLEVCLGAWGTSLSGVQLGGSSGGAGGGVAGAGGGSGVAGAGGGDGLAFPLWNIRSSQKGLESISKKGSEGSRGEGDSGSKSSVVGWLWGISTSELSKAHHEESGPYLGKDRGGKGRGLSSSSAWTGGFPEGSGYLSVGPGDV